MAAIRGSVQSSAPTQELVFPESDSKPMGETGFHVKCALAIIAMLESRFRRQDVYVGAYMFVYSDPADPSEVVCPDVFVVFGVRPGERRTWKVWEEGKAPDVVFELTSKGTRHEDRYTKPAIYEELGVREYFLFDPEGDYLNPRLQGFRLADSGYQPLTGERLHSERLGLELLIEDRLLRFHDPATDQMLRTPAEYEEATQAAEAEITRLRDELARLRGSQPQ